LAFSSALRKDAENISNTSVITEDRGVRNNVFAHFGKLEKVGCVRLHSFVSLREEKSLPVLGAR